ncbi:MAG: hypothetical protein JSS95_02765 [Acidobacteria bacterium]|nr:hypothetical protein [Acidobacteriota bacterium]
MLLDILLMVLILFVISVICFFALAGTAIVIVRHVRAGQRRSAVTAPPEPSFTQHLYAATEYGSARPPRQVPHQTVQGITAKKAWNAPSQSVEIHPAAEEPVAGKRKSPQPVHSQRAQFAGNRVDWDYFNKDYGDLSDPHPSRPVRAASGSRSATRKRS